VTVGSHEGRVLGEIGNVIGNAQFLDSPYLDITDGQGHHSPRFKTWFTRGSAACRPVVFAQRQFVAGWMSP
jgi:hypothetical protein